MIEILEYIRKFIKSDEYAKTSIKYEETTIKIVLYGGNDEERVFIQIYAPWRIIKNSMFINSSGFYSNESDLELLHYKESTEELSKLKITKIRFRPESKDLILKWEDGTMLESFSLQSEQHCYHMHDATSRLSVDVSYGKVLKWS